MMRRKYSWLIGLFCVTVAAAQEFTYEAKIAPVDVQAYYKVALSSELLGKLELYRSDLRIYNSAGVEQPYLLRQEAEVSTTSLFKSYEIIEKLYQKEAISHLIFHNPEKKAINNVSFVVKNTDVQKRARLSGSDNQQNWYVIKDNYLLHSMHSDDETSELKILNFPLSDYEYFKLEINDNWRLPINIFSVGYYDTQLIKGQFTTFNCPIIEQKDSLKTTYVKLVLPETKYLERLQFEVSGAEFYSRRTSVLRKREMISSKKKVVEYFETIGSFDLNSNSENVIDLGGISVQEIFIEIENRDNQPLKVEKVLGSYLNQYAVVSLIPTSVYLLKFGNDELSRPDYDLAVFANQIPEDLTTINHESIKPLQPGEEVLNEPTIFDNPYIIWSVIGVVGLVLGFISVKMIREMGQVK